MSTNEETRRRLHEAAVAVSLAVQVLRAQTEMFEAYEREAEHMDSVGPILDPTLFMSAERQAADAVMRPLFAAAHRFVREYDVHVAAARGAVGEVAGHG